MAKVLLVDDNGSVLLTLAIALRRHGHEVTIAGDGHAALQELRTAAFDALVSDVRMPGLMGPELAEQARKLHPEMRIILTSAYPSVESNAEITAFLRKPIDIEQLHAALSPPPETAPRHPRGGQDRRSLAEGVRSGASFPFERRREPRRGSVRFHTAHA